MLKIDDDCIYRSDRIKLIDTYQFNDSANDAFQREPYCVKFGLHDTGRPGCCLGFVLLHHFLGNCRKMEYLICC